jgi:3-deoxy-D-manno-octulosonic-acid transferase
MFFLYRIFIRLYTFAIRLAALFNSKARRWVSGRKNQFDVIREKLSASEKKVWFHTSSLGEFEQARPVMERFKNEFPDYKIVLTFFSPSGYEIRKNYEGADYIFYLPEDTRTNARKWLELVRPEKVFFVKYDFWFNYINEIYKRNIPLYFFSVKLRKNQYFFKWYGGWFRKQLHKINYLFVQDQTTLELLHSIGYNNAIVSGDTRFDRVLSVTQHAREFPVAAAFVNHSQVIIAGSTWPVDEDMLKTFIVKQSGNYKYIIAPHEIHEERIQEWIKIPGKKVLRFSLATIENVTDADILIVDSIGILMHLYKYGHVAYIGGGFGKNVHNILESATFGVPVVFGPNYHKFQEIHDLIALHGAFPVNNYGEFEQQMLQLLNDKTLLVETSSICASFVKNSAGATEGIFECLHQSIKTNNSFF